MGDGDFLKFSYVAIPLIVTGKTPDEIMEVVKRFDREFQALVDTYQDVISELSMSQCIACFTHNLENAENSADES